MLARVVLNPILENEALTRGLRDPEARILVEWLVERVEYLSELHPEVAVRPAVELLCRRARAIGRFVTLWCHSELHGAAAQLAASEQFAWPLPSEPMDADELMTVILDWESNDENWSRA